MKSLRKVVAIVFIGIFTVGMLAACGGGNQSTGGSSAPAGSGSSAALTPEMEEQERFKEQTDTANIRHAYADIMAAYITDSQPHSMTVPATQELAGWQDENCGKITSQIDGEEINFNFTAHTKDDGPYTVSVSNSEDGLIVVVGDYSATVKTAGSGSSAALASEMEELERSKEQTDTANVRHAYADVMAAYITDYEPHSVTVPATQEQAGWQNEDQGQFLTMTDGVEKTYYFAAHTKDDGPYTISVSKGEDDVIVVIE